MITPAGIECANYYEDFQRGSSRQECRARRHPRSIAWQPADCTRCPVPGILAANGNPRLELTINVRSGMLGFGRRVDVEAWCAAHGPIIEDPHVGCPDCNAEADELLKEALDL